MIASSLHLAPEEQSVLGGPGGLALLVRHDGDLLDLEPEDDRPDESEGEPRAAVDDVVRAHVLQVDALLIEEAERLVHIF